MMTDLPEETDSQTDRNTGTRAIHKNQFRFVTVNDADGSHTSLQRREE